MKILLDECLDRRFAKDFLNHEVRTVSQMGWAGIKNGELMRLTEKEFDVFVTVDRNLSYQQNLPNFDIAVIVIRSISNRYQDLAPFSTRILEILPMLKRGKAFILAE